MKSYTDLEEENEWLQARIRKLECQNETLRKESNQYLSNWVAAQDLASVRQVQLLINSK
jgi:hypothetical protein